MTINKATIEETDTHLEKMKPPIEKMNIPHQKTNIPYQKINNYNRKNDQSIGKMNIPNEKTNRIIASGKVVKRIISQYNKPFLYFFYNN